MFHITLLVYLFVRLLVTKTEGREPLSCQPVSKNQATKVKKSFEGPIQFDKYNLLVTYLVIFIDA